MKALMKLIFCMALAVSAALPAWAHKGSDAYLDVQQMAGTGKEEASYMFALSVALKDWDQLVPVDGNADGRITWGEVKAATPQMLALLNDNAKLETVYPTATPACPLDWQFDRMEQRSDGTYLRAVTQANCRATLTLALRYSLFKDQDATHRLLVAGHIHGQDVLTTLSPQQRDPWLLRHDLSTPTERPSASPRSLSVGWQTLCDYFALGMRHLLEGYDHLAFLLALVLPLRLNLRRVGALSVREVQAASVWWVLLRTITAFTVGHSITLMLATLGWTQASPLWVEPVIAASIAVTALLNVYPKQWLRTDILALLFGLVHGFGFAGLLQEAAAPTGLLPWALGGFNLGIEAGQLLAVSLWVVFSQMVVTHKAYDRVVVRGGSWLLALLAMVWFWERI